MLDRSARARAGLDAIERVVPPAGAALPGRLRAAAVSLAAVDGPARADVRGAGGGLRAVAAGADARRAGGAAAAAGAPPTQIAAFRRDLAAALARVPWLPTAIVAIAVLRYAIYFSIVTIRNHYNLQTAGYDLGIENNLVWNAAHWNAPLFKTSVHAGGPPARTSACTNIHLVSDRPPLPPVSAAGIRCWRCSRC